MFQLIGYVVVAGMLAYTVWTLVAPVIEGDTLKKRMEGVATAREAMKQDRFAQLESGALRADGRGKMRDMVEKFSLETLLAAPELKEKLAQAGMRGQRPMYMFYMSRMILPLGGLAISILLFWVLNPWDLVFVRQAGFTVGLVGFGYYLPSIYVKNAASKRQASIMPVFPDALDLLLICVEAGMSVEVAFGRVAEEMAENSVELAEEFQLTTAELSYMNSRRVAYENLARRNQHEGIRSVATALVQAERYGTPLGSTLRTLSNENRQMRVLAAEKKAASLPAKLTVPMMLFFLPVLFIVLLTPAVMRLMSAL